MFLQSKMKKTVLACKEKEGRVSMERRLAMEPEPRLAM